MFAFYFPFYVFVDAADVDVFRNSGDDKTAHYTLHTNTRTHARTRYTEQYANRTEHPRGTGNARATVENTFHGQQGGRLGVHSNALSLGYETTQTTRH